MTAAWTDCYLVVYLVAQLVDSTVAVWVAMWEHQLAEATDLHMAVSKANSKAD